MWAMLRQRKQGEISLSLAGPKSRTSAPNGLKRSHAAALDDEEEQESERYGRAQRVSHFDRAAGGAIDENNKKDESPLIIPRQSNRDWRDAAQQRSRQRPQHSTQQAATAQTNQMNAVEANRPAFGLNVFATEAAATASASSADATESDIAHSIQNVPSEAAHASVNAPVRPRTDDEVALDALLGRTVEDTSLVLPQATAATSESDAFRNDFSRAPPMASLDDYARVPVEQFGAALLRGMGWKDGEGLGSQKGQKIVKTAVKPPERRGALLGIGAKEDAAIAQEIGAWGKAAKGGKGEIKIYNPVLLRDKQTGELFTEEELQRKKEREEREKHERDFDRKEKDRKRRDREDRDEDGGQSREKDRAREREKDRERSHRTDDGRRDERHRHEGRRERADSDDEHRRSKDKERRRRHDRESEEASSKGYDRDRDRDRDRDHRSHRHGERERHGHRHRESERRR
ncbi:uncharacterized protein K489DRAFT_387703 [Dissoconium aciculare CBS 342.82]|uniref:Pre-mRNA-splicing factor n=1 Tax=Dissoconium aciculare CBS 342.82 TaxID=1314786 RepID=A0A6J3M930_9PEZI|nr:uncharacterized protein K489DRAFT_387703 [Dissoconium aciculare CBS 342.82]KAF1824119.1 hypothetical protein K489DRAFT_387703 [Dissoconium aciculare CBS 342.82]